MALRTGQVTERKFVSRFTAKEVTPMGKETAMKKVWKRLTLVRIQYSRGRV